VSGGGRWQASKQSRRTLEDGYSAGKEEELYGVARMWEFEVIGRDGGEDGGEGRGERKE
jgi:hypothetical protein